MSAGLHVIGANETSRIFGANDKIRVGFIGIGNRGSQLLKMFMNNKDCEVAALCDAYEPYTTRNREQVNPRFIESLEGRIPKMGEQFAKPPKIYKDYRDLLADKDIDAVCIATPDHWHALQTIHAIQAGKDVYVEKPLTATIYEGRKMVEVQAASNQVVGVGLNRRGSAVYQKLAKEIPNGKIGKVSAARAARISNMFPHGIGKMAPEQPPKGLDWDMWLGPRGIRPYQYNMAPYYFRWWSDFSSQM
ncbi:MAG: Gfo/Idh/MocA family oxidoreductase, partial [Bacteroidetes bacterium]|nr:Gfo/Idh/MocA family oxidoreductase [Bacteroidota bacterium]